MQYAILRLAFNCDKDIFLANVGGKYNSRIASKASKSTEIAFANTIFHYFKI